MRQAGTSEDDYSQLTNDNIRALKGEDLTDNLSNEFLAQFADVVSGETVDRTRTYAYVREAIGNMTDDEKDLYFYYLPDQEKANNYLKELVNQKNGMVSHRTAEERVKSTQEYAEQGMGEALSLGLGPLVQTFLATSRVG